MNIYQFFRPFIFQLNPETAHNLAIKFLKYTPNFVNLFSDNCEYENLNQNVFGLHFPNPIGLAAGFDKNAECLLSLSRFGFGFLEVGTVTKNPQDGNPKPRIFRLEKDQALINCLGFNNLGADIFAENIEHFFAEMPKGCVTIGINIGKNKDSKDAIQDYLDLMVRFYTKASYITINISSPNTKNLRNLQESENLTRLIEALTEKRNSLQIQYDYKVPILIKIAPDLNKTEQEKIAKIILTKEIEGIIISNTTIDRKLDLKTTMVPVSGGLSGKPLFEKSNQVLKNIYQLTQGKIPIIAVGGISSASDAYYKIKLGASLVQIYSTLIYQGFGAVERFKEELSDMVKADGYDSIAQAVGVMN